uniref:Hydroxylysine kinase n=1 Tax=Lygus hesperus TaxID=30085 RepID=A0A0A9YU39_LYGHE
MIRAAASESDVRSRIARLYPLEVLKIKQLEGYDDLNFYLECRSEDDDVTYRYVCKVVNNQDSQKPEIIEAQNRLMEHLGKKGISVPEPVPNNWLQYFSLETFGETKHLIRLLTYVDGSKLNDCSPSTELYFNVGDFTGRIYSALKGYKDDDLTMRKSPWMLSSVPDLHQFLRSVQNEQHQELARTAVQDFEDKVVPAIPELEKGVMHGDINEHNILARDTSIVGLIDFGDNCWGPVIFEIALCLAYMCLHSNDISTGKHVLAGYQIHRPLTSIENKIIKSCVCARLAQSLVLGCHSALEDQGNAYILSSQKNGWPILTQLSALDDTHIAALWGLE